MNENRWASRRAKAMPVDMFATMDAAKSQARARGLEIIDLSLGASDLHPPASALRALREATDDPATYGYCLHACTQPFREAAARWYGERYRCEVDPETQVLPLIGSQEGFANLLFATTDPGDTILLPDPGFPSYFGAVAVAGLDVVPTPLLAENGFLPDLSAIGTEDARRARVMVISYPNNPTAAVASDAFMREVAEFCADNDILLVHDFPYVDLVFGDYEAPSVLVQPGGLRGRIELYSCSKSFHMGGFRLGWAIGDAEVIAALARVKGSIDFNQYLGIQRAAIAALAEPRRRVRQDAAEFQARRDVLVETLNQAGWETPLPKASLYVWTRLPSGLSDSFAFTVNLARETGIALAPGRGFGVQGEGFVRFALVRDAEVLKRAVERIHAFLD
ncbi:MAG: aminotransferase class I/II-fold pyridoxal phosphate-dependent enzyme [Trueperaceae bacterium]|nr:MAG: aminotransferase class I/II-fold pyridoxal phosphate-dependent enzyme [Trueperaceae bacterium]